MRISGIKPLSVILSTPTYSKMLKCVVLMMPKQRNSGFFHIIFAKTLTANNIRLTHITPSILINANALGYNLL